MTQHTKILSCNVILLPTEDYSPLVMSSSSYGGLLLTKYYGSAWTHMGDKYQHLYLVSEREIKKDDWFIADEKYLIQCKSTGDSFINGNFYRIKCKKIIATTNLSLKLPTIKDQDLIWYSRQTNDGKDINTVNIELQDTVNEDNTVNILHFSLENK